MEPNKDFTNADPDYENYNLALKEIEKESEENNLTSERLHNIIAEEFDKELTFRQQQLEEIEDKIFKAQKLLHLVRYVLVSSYYNKRNLEYESTNENPSTSIFDAQNRIHPAVKKLLGNNSLDVLAARGKRKVHYKNNESSENQEQYQPQQVKKVKLKDTASDNVKCNSVETIQNSLKRKKTRHRILIGNISKWMPSLENDNTTHKWMVYVRGPKEAPDVSHIIEKVIFYLHPSYKPHDVVEVSEYPFHLSRRGWGEFPLRVQIFFKCTLNKPVSIVHNLKLDKTYTGRQTLGNETVVDLYLHGDVPVKSEPEAFKDNNHTIPKIKDESGGLFMKDESYEEKIKKEVVFDEAVINKMIVEDEVSVDVKYELPTTSSVSEHSYCHDDEIKIEDEVVKTSVSDTSLLDHSYSLPYNNFSDIPQCPNVKDDKSNDTVDQGNNLVFGLDDSYRDDSRKATADIAMEKCVVRTFTTATGQPIKVLPQSFNKVLLSNGSIVQIKLLKAPQSFMKKVNVPNTKEDKTDSDKYKVDFNPKLFKNLGEALPYLFKRLPLWSDSASNPDFNHIYPYIARSEKEFLSWNIGKQLSSEWSRAKNVKSIICAEGIAGCQEWNTKSFFMYGRSHGYSPRGLGGILFNKPPRELELLMTCFSESPPQQNFQNNITNDITVDVVDDNVPSPASRGADAVDISDSSLRHHCAFVKEAALDCGVVLKSEEIEEGVRWNGAERMILEAVRCLADHLIRRATHHTICQGNFSGTAEVGVREVKIAMSERSEIKSIREYQKKRLVKDFFS